MIYLIDARNFTYGVTTIVYRSRITSRANDDFNTDLDFVFFFKSKV